MSAQNDERNASDFLREAAQIMDERGKQYDQKDGERSMSKTVGAFNVLTGRAGTERALSEPEGWLFMQTLKNVRQFQRPGFHEDSALDAIAYQSLMAEAKKKEANINEHDNN